MKAVLIVSHGSRVETLKVEMAAIAEALKKRTGLALIECAFLEINTPTIPEGIARCVERGACEIIILLNFLNAGQHTHTDIPAFVQDARHSYPQVTFRVSNPLGRYSGLLDVFCQVIDSVDRP